MLGSVLIFILILLFFYILFYQKGPNCLVYAFYSINLLIINLLIFFTKQDRNLTEEYFIPLIVLMTVFFISSIIWSHALERKDD